jgi:hypothetical protein
MIQQIRHRISFLLLTGGKAVRGGRQLSNRQLQAVLYFESGEYVHRFLIEGAFARILGNRGVPMAYSFRMSPGRCLSETLKARVETRSMNEITKRME